MARIEFSALGHAYPGAARHALEPMSMTWDDGGAYALLGPSGCGKTTLLNIISGLIVPSEGRVLFDGRDVTSLPPRTRNIAQVFQFPVLYDTMSVYDNLAFPLRNRGVGAREVDARVREVAALLDLDAVLREPARGLAADAKQKISLGRGLVRRDVAAILFDEPLTVIDPHLKWQLRQQLKKIHQELRLTLIYVTHDQVEALTFADEVVVMTDGQVVQKGTPESLFLHPDHSFVGYFIGSPGMNLFTLLPQTGGFGLGGFRLDLPAAMARRLDAAAAAGHRIALGVRPEFVSLVEAGTPGAIPVDIGRVQALGASTLVTATLAVSGQAAAQGLHLRLSSGATVAPGRAWVQLTGERTVYFADDRRLS